MALFTLTQQQALSLVPHFSGALSIVGNACIIKSVVGDISDGNACTYHRLLLGMSSLDCLTSLSLGLSTWPMPKDTPGVWQPLGTTATCTAQGFFVQMMVGVPIYNGSLAIYHLLECRYNWSEKRIIALEPFMHAVPLTMAVATAVAGIPLKLFNNADLWCGIAAFPTNCKSSDTSDGEGNCLRGENAEIYRLFFLYGPVWSCMIVAMISLFLVYCTVLQQEKDVDRFQYDGSSRRQRSRRVAWQAFWYSMAFYSSWVPATITRIQQSNPSMYDDRIEFPFMLLMAIGLPLQGMLNFMVFYRAKYLKYRRDRPNATVFESLKKSAFFRVTLEVEVEAMPDFTVSVVPVDDEKVNDDNNNTTVPNTHQIASNKDETSRKIEERNV